MDDREPIEIFYADPVDEDGNVIGTAHFEITEATGWPARATKVPHSELAIDEDTPTIRVREEDFPTSSASTGRSAMPDARDDGRYAEFVRAPWPDHKIAISEHKEGRRA